jgi:hypothetical protein
MEINKARDRRGHVPVRVAHGCCGRNSRDQHLSSHQVTGEVVLCEPALACWACPIRAGEWPVASVYRRSRTCPYVAAFIRRHPDHLDLVDEAHRDRVTG